MKVLLGYILIFIFSISTAFGSEPTSIKVTGKSYNYTVLIPKNWGVIPNDTLIKKFGKGTFDIGLYNLKNKNYFDGEFVQYIYLPTLNTLNQFPFEAITRDVKNSFDAEKNLQKKEDTHLVTHNFRANKEKFMFFIDGKIKSNKKDRICHQNVLLTKFGFLKIFYYDALGNSTHNNAYDDVFTKVSFPAQYKYAEPALKPNNYIWNIAIALTFGLVVYFGILYFSKIKQLFSKTH
jgi:hypothetical protein